MKHVAFTFSFNLFLVLFLVLSVRFCHAQLVINEILASPSLDWDGSGAYYYRDDEWVEVYNSTDCPIVLDGYRLTDAETTWRYAFTGVLPARSFLVVFGSQSYAWEKENGFPAYGLSLNNTGDTVRLWRLTASDTTVVDSFAYGAVEAGTDRSVGRWPDAAGDWCLFDELNPYTGTPPPYGTGCPPTPGAINGCLTAAENGTWGRVKSLFR